ncbi:PREDICTED: glycosyltransferase 25 family member [Nicrophorus vespilloides]|uniref:Glycosyltransferase 25 family member n=1 Tax=Nicrophorus vespilloides TaxID=110193 RepID=A0ABM1MNQ4_NICVS|nr:PREDICTED: glycosyltransferase 25 family member [Nicrophorus vespilloides]
MLKSIVLILFALSQTLLAEVKEPTVVVGVLIRNKGHTLPYFLTHLERLDYPKHRISLWIRSDHNTDNSIEIIKKWLYFNENHYHSVNVEYLQDADKYENESGPAHWTSERFNHVINLREAALNHARRIWADYLLVIDADAFLTNPRTLKSLISKNVTIAAPMLKSDGLYSNFWHGMTDDYYYERTEDYKPVLNREKKGCFPVPMVHSCVLIDLRNKESDLLTYNPEYNKEYDGPKDDIIIFAMSAKSNNIDLMICNEETYGFIMVPLDQEEGVLFDLLQLSNLKLEMLNEYIDLEVDSKLAEYVEPVMKDSLGFDKIFMINLVRRPERRDRMVKCFDELGLDVQIIDAVDGKNLNETFLSDIDFLPEYADPFHKRAMTLGEIGCFMSHYNIWMEIIEKGYETSLVLEDDIRFEPFFRIKVRNLMDEVHRLPNWDLVYFGRKRLQESDESWVPNSKYLVEAGYSYWTLGYVLSLRGAEKLLAAEPLKRLLPVDEYFPILFDRHPEANWKGHFLQRDLVALSAAPLLLYPTHYTGENGYISDTEDSIIVQNNTRDEF